ncbi:expansin-A9-like [Abrus precatorius]|uniref:Expansin n=1 Tax=Abrus precatorius TaxID=3816 RepID=A0A8B8KZ35_ABRPR|nr:expansin-A9-like [Abrus precatorius]
MAFPLGALMTSSLFFLVAFALPNVHANISSSWRYAAHNNVGRDNKMVNLEHNHPVFGPGPWRLAHATFYEGGSGTFGGACGYEDVVKEGYGLDTAALSTVLFKQGQTCGACYEIKCVDSPQWCKAGQPSIFVTATNLCPPNYSQSGDNGGWCNPPREHFDLAKPAYLKIAAYKAGIVPVQYRRIPCKKQGGIRFTITGNPYFNLIKVWNVGGAGDITAVHVKGDKTNWIELKRNWGQKWATNAMLVGATLTLRVRASDGRYSTSLNVVPHNWQFGQTFEGKNFA